MNVTLTSDSTPSVIKPSLDTIRSVADKVSPFVLRTPTVAWPVSPELRPGRGELFVKLELLQRTGSFKPRGAINNIQQLLGNSNASDLTEHPGVTAFSAGNHAIATAYAARSLGVSAKVVMPRSANPFRVERCQQYGAEVVFGETIADLLSIVKALQADEGRHLIHPFESEHTIAGTAGVGLELCNDIESLDAVIVPVGGGGLIAGIAAAVKQLQPNCLVFGVEPTGACGMQQSVAQGAPMEKVVVDTIADSLGAPMHAPLTFANVRDHVDELVQVSDDELRAAMRQMFDDMKLAVEPACAAALAALNRPLAARLVGKRVALIACGSNIDMASYQRLLA